jgi:RNA polymerase sigma-70 factor (ECF subfamily)
LKGGTVVPLRDIDRNLVDRCLRKEPGAWNNFIDRYTGLIYHVIQHAAYARSRLLSSEDVEDIAAEVLLKIVDNDYAVLRKFKGISSLPTYLTVIARRTCVNELIKRHREEELGHTNAHRAFTDDGASGEVEAILTAEEVERMLDDLGEREAQVVRLYHLKFLNYRQIGKQLGIPENSVGPMLAKARKKLRESAEKQQSTS